MAITDILNYYEEVKDDLKFLNYYKEVEDDLNFQDMSSVQTKIMICLSEGPKKTEDLQKSTRIPTHTILHNIIKLEMDSLTLKNGNYYHLSRIGKERTSQLINMIKKLIVLKNNQKLWLNHEISAIPDDLLMKIGALIDSELIESQNTNMDNAHEAHIQMVLNAKEIRGVSPVFYSDYTATFINVLKKDVKVELILTEAILRRTIESISKIKNLNKLISIISTGNLTIWETKEDVKIAFTVTDNCLSLALFSAHGDLDATKNLISEQNDAIAWGNELFDYYLENAQKVDLKYLMNNYLRNK